MVGEKKKKGRKEISERQRRVGKKNKKRRDIREDRYRGDGESGTDSIERADQPTVGVEVFYIEMKKLWTPVVVESNSA